MESAQRRLYDAAREGSVSSLLKLLEEDPIILDRVTTLGTYAETPLHIAAMLGNLDFAKELLKRKPSLASELGLYKSTPLHIASATINVELVTLLLNVSPGNMCRARDAYGRYPVHVAAIRGRVDVLKKLLQADPAAALAGTDQGDSILHLCVKYNQVEALKVLMETLSDPAFVNCKNGDGNTALHLSVLDKQSEAVSYLLQSKTIDVNAKNAKGQTALDILYKDGGGMIGRALQNAGAVITSNNYSTSNLPSNPLPENSKRKTSMIKFFEDKQEAVMIAASLIAAAAFQAGVNPPGGLHNDTVDDNLKEVVTKHIAGTSILAYSNPRLYIAFIVENTVGFVAALSVFLLLLSGLPQKHKFFKGLFMVSIWMSIIAILASYISSVMTVAPPPVEDGIRAIFYTVLGITVAIWVLIILWFLGLGPRRVKNIKQKRSSENGPTIQSDILLGSANNGTQSV